MTVTIPTLHEHARGCGYRKGGGLYLMAGKPEEPCSALPVELRVCPTCGEGVRPARGWTWVDADALLGLPIEHPPDSDPVHDRICPLDRKLGRCGLIWIGEGFYPTPADFMREAVRMGISRRITAVPREFECGKDWVLLAHRKAGSDTCVACLGRGHSQVPGAGLVRCDECDGTGRLDVAGVFTLFRPERVEYVVKGDESDDDLERLVKRGIQPVRVKPIEEQGELEEAA